jgi:succinylglutamate desuccinylase
MEKVEHSQIIEKIQSVAIVGGTHGNEFTGTTAIKQWQANDQDLQGYGLDIQCLLANVKAHQQTKRYIDQDLNRCFTFSDLQNVELSGYEQQRAKVLNQLIGPKEDSKTDVVIDLHTTTAEMGVTIVINTEDVFYRKMVVWLKKQMPFIHVFYEPRARLEDNFLTSLGRYNGILVEVGAVPQGLIQAEKLAQTKQAVLKILEYIQLFNAGSAPDEVEDIDAFQFIRKLKMPETKNGELNGFVHQDRQGQDYERIKKGDVLFESFSGEVVCWQEDESVYGAFINEAAYYDQNHGLSVMKKIRLSNA